MWLLRETFDFFPSSYPSFPLTSHYVFLHFSSLFVQIFCSVQSCLLPPLLSPLSLYFLSSCNFLFPYKYWERQGCVGGHGAPPRKVWGFGQNRLSFLPNIGLIWTVSRLWSPIQLQWFQLDSKRRDPNFLCTYLFSKVGAPEFPFLKSPEPKRGSSECKAWLRRSRTSLRVWFIPKWSIVMHQTCFPYKPVGREHADKLLQDVTRQAVQKENGSLCVELRRSHL